MKIRGLVHAMAVLALAWGTHASAGAFGFEGVKTVSAVKRDGGKVVIGHVRFEPRSDGSIGFALEMERQAFSDHFLSMKEFKCLQAPDEVSCHVPYPYANPAVIRDGDLAWLEHSLLFLFKQPRDFGAKLWNGLYYHFERTDRALVGRPEAIDLNDISSPPADPSVAPYRGISRDPVPEGARWLASIVIE